MSEHTPGPWSAVYNGHFWDIGPEAKSPFSHVQVFRSERIGNNADADARLVAAAPKMLAALKMVRETDDDLDFGFTEQERDQLHDAIAAAELPLNHD